jgi:preprotein translocase subunit YajC
LGIVGIIVWFVALGAAFFFLVVRPQRRTLAAHRALVAALRVGDEIVTAGGIYGTVRGLADETVDLEIAPGVVVKIARGAVAHRAVEHGAADPANGEVA